MNERRKEMHFDEFHNHKWAKNLKLARDLVHEKKYQTFYRGMDLPDGDIYPGMRVMSAYWISVEHEMKMRARMLLNGTGDPTMENDSELQAQWDLFQRRFIDDMRELIIQKEITSLESFEERIQKGIELPDDWQFQLQELQNKTEAELSDDQLNSDLIEAWFDSCLRSVANYNRFLIWCGIIAAKIFRDGGEIALYTAVDQVSETFKWEISREFYVNVMPSVGFEDLGDLMELGMRGMFSDQYYETGQEVQEGETMIKTSLLKNCELAGVFWRVAEWNGLPKTALGYGICRFCEAHGDATMMITIPPSYAPKYKRVVSIGMDDEICRFELKLTPADDFDRLMLVQEKVFS
jgi:hypothetical protein